MISILKTDTTWRPEQVNEVKYILRSNKTFTVRSKDFVDYDTGINIDFPENCNIVFKLYNNDSLVLRDNVLEFSNYLSDKSTIVTVTNYSDESITIRDTQYFLSFETIPKSHGNQLVVEPAVEPVVEPVTETETVAEPVAESVAEPLVETVAELVAESVAETVVEPVVETVAELVVEPVVESVAETVVEPVVETVAEIVVEPVVEPVTELVTETTTEPVTETTTEPVVEQKKRKYVKRKP